MIKGIILDVDGVIVGEKVGYNSPYPHPDVMERLKSIEEKGIQISLCTARPHYSVGKIIKEAGLKNMHITDGGAVITDPIDDTVLKAHVIPHDLVKRIVTAYLKADIYVEIYTPKDYIIQASQAGEITKKHMHIMQKEPAKVESLIAEVDKQDVVKVMPITPDEDRTKAREIFRSFEDELTLSWGIHPYALPHQFGIITAKGISKKQAALEIASHSRIGTSELLGVGDNANDWQFMEQCGYVATLANGSADIKKYVSSRESNAYISDRSVDENGVIAIFDHFGFIR
jgi:HAD superfamily hydrolase (TIGR01484 family)